MSEWKRNCPVCKKELSYTTKNTLVDATQKSRKCKSCVKKGKYFTDEHKQKLRELNTGKNNAMYGKRHSEAHKARISKKMLGKLDSLETRQKKRLATLKRMERCVGQIIPAYNPEGCKVFNEINEHFKWNGIHAENGGEYQIKELGYWVDYYEPNLNIIIEYDEAHHKGKRQIKDERRQKEITAYLNCTFYRIRYDQNWREVLLTN